jgi:hypothetical protein
MKATICSWKMPNGSDYTLSVDVLVEPLDVSHTFYRVRGVVNTTINGRQVYGWSWKRWSMASKPTVKVSAECAEVLDGLVRDHPDLSRLLHLIGLDDEEASE